MNEASTSVNELNINGSAPLGHSQIANSMFYGLPAESATSHDGIHSLSLATMLADQRALYGNDSEFLRTFFDPRSCNLSPLNGISSLNALSSFKPTFPCLNFNSKPNRTEALTRAVRDIDANFFESLPIQISEVPLPVLNSTNCDDLSPYSLSLQEGINNGNTNRYSEANQWRAIAQQNFWCIRSFVIRPISILHAPLKEASGCRELVMLYCQLFSCRNASINGSPSHIHHAL